MNNKLVSSNYSKNGYVKVRCSSNNVIASYDYDSDFSIIVSNVKFKFDKKSICWSRISESKEESYEITTQLITELLEAGFGVEILNSGIELNIIYSKVVNGDYKVLYSRYIRFYDDNKTKVKIYWSEFNRELYGRAKELPGAKWDYNNKCIIVSINNYKQIEDFAEIENFNISYDVKELFELMQKNEMVSVNKKKIAEDDKLKSILNSSADIIDDLRDED